MRIRNPKSQKLSFANLTKMNVARCEELFHKINDWTPTDWACAMAGECGEACYLIKKYRRLDEADQSKDTVRHRAFLIEAIGNELADVVIYADLLAFRFGLSLGDEVRAKFNEVSIRRHSKRFL